MRLIDEADAGFAEPYLRSEFPSLDDRPIEVGAGESIAEPFLQLLKHARTRVERHGAIERLRDGSKLIDSVAVVAVRVSHDHAGQLVHLGREQLLAQVGTAVD